MSLMIKGAKMPSNCKECEYKFCIDCVKYIGFHHKDEARANNCPLIELPEKHGRLIDADIAYDKIAEQEGGYYMDMDGVDKGLSETPTIIEAEGDEG